MRYERHQWKYQTEKRVVFVSLTDDLSLHIFELPKSGSHDSLSEWLRFFNHAHEEDKPMRTHYQNPAIHKAFDRLEEMSADEQTRLRAEIREKALKNEVSMLAAAKREGERIGIEKNRKQIAFNMLSKGMDVKMISQITGLSEDEIRKLQELLWSSESELKKSSDHVRMLFR